MNFFAGLIDRPATNPEPKSSKPKRESKPQMRQKLHGVPAVVNPWHLTPHQAFIMGYLALGLGNQEIADRVGLKVKTVELHTRNAYERMQVIELGVINRVRAAVLWDRFTRENTQPKDNSGSL